MDELVSAGLISSAASALPLPALPISYDTNIQIEPLDWGNINRGLVRLVGGCDINFLTGKGVASEGLDEGKPLKGKFKPVKLADWSAEECPKACEF